MYEATPDGKNKLRRVVKEMRTEAQTLIRTTHSLRATVQPWNYNVPGLRT